MLRRSRFADRYRQVSLSLSLSMLRVSWTLTRPLPLFSLADFLSSSSAKRRFPDTDIGTRFRVNCDDFRVSAPIDFSARSDGNVSMQA